MGLAVQSCPRRRASGNRERFYAFQLQWVMLPSGSAHIPPPNIGGRGSDGSAAGGGGGGGGGAAGAGGVSVGHCGIA